MHNIIVIQTTVSSIEHAKQLATQIVSAKLVGCVQIDGPINSVYCWHGSLCDEVEYRLTCKTLMSLRQEAVDFLTSHHLYELPEMIVFTVEASESYATWLANQIAA